jgi:CheY-like chemotaxis protein
VQEASHGVEALKIGEQHPGLIHLLITDMVMPEGMSGREVAMRLRERRPQLPVIYTSGYSAELTGEQLSLGKHDAFLQKPASPQQFLETIRQCLGN